MITIFFDTNSDVPLYEQLYRYIRGAIEENELHANEKLPSKRRLAQHLKVSVITVETAYNQLVAEGYIKAVPRSGFYVLPFIKLKPNISSQIQSTSLFRNKAPKYDVDFKTNQVDSSSFPYDKFAKIEREIILDEYQNTINQSDYLGFYSLREQIAELLFEYRGIQTKPESIVIGSGSEHLISLIVLLLGRDNVFGVEEPGYLKNYRLYQDYGAKSVTIPLDDQGLDMLQNRIANIIHVTPSHQFPSGKVTTIQRRMELLNWAMNKENHYIIEDDYDSEFRFSGIPIPAMKSMDSMDKVIYMNSFSKSIAPSLRVSFMVLPDKLMQTYHDSYSYFTCSVPIQTQLVLAKFIRMGEYEKHLNRMKNIYKNKRDELIELFEQSSFHQHVNIIGEESGLHFLIQLESKTPANTFVESAKEAGVRIYGLYEYCLDKQCKNDEILLVLGYSHLTSLEMKFAISKLEQAWKKYF